MSGLQAQIDDAVNGATISVAPGLYLGGLNFHGKNITLQSSGGPARTIIHGNGVTAVRMGPGGALKGFTISGSVFAPAVEIVASAGSVISGNIFDGNGHTIGPSEVISGNVASPLVERNVFRNNSCDNQFSSAVISFINSSSPQIINNVFENNQCRGVNLRVDRANTPVVAHNTLVGNRAGIKIERGIAESGHIYRNNIIVQNGIGLEIDIGLPIGVSVWENNLVFGNAVDYQGTANQTGINGNISANPMFVNGATGDYHLQAGSPAIDAGSPVGAPPIDFDGMARPMRGGWDIGAFEAP